MGKQQDAVGSLSFGDGGEAPRDCPAVAGTRDHRHLAAHLVDSRTHQLAVLVLVERGELPVPQQTNSPPAPLSRCLRRWARNPSRSIEDPSAVKALRGSPVRPGRSAHGVVTRRRRLCRRSAVVASIRSTKSVSICSRCSYSETEANLQDDGSASPVRVGDRISCLRRLESDGGSDDRRRCATRQVRCPRHRGARVPHGTPRRAGSDARDRRRHRHSAKQPVRATAHADRARLGAPRPDRHPLRRRAAGAHDRDELSRFRPRPQDGQTVARATERAAG